MERGPSDKVISSAVYTKLIANVYTQRTHTDWMGGKGSNHEHLYNLPIRTQTFKPWVKTTLYYVR